MFKSLPIHHFSTVSSAERSTAILTSLDYPPRSVAAASQPVAASRPAAAAYEDRVQIAMHITKSLPEEKLRAEFDRQAFIEWLQSVKNQEKKTAIGVASAVGTFAKSGKAPEEFVKSYSKPNSYNGMLVAMQHYMDYLGQPRLALKQKPRVINSLIISPKPAEVLEIIRNVESDDVRCYLALCATVGLRPQRLLKAKWTEIDFENLWVMIDERHGKKRYVPNPLHRDVAAMLQALPQSGERVFGFAYKKVATELQAIGTKWRPNNLRDHFYNEGRRHADHDIIEWLMGHRLPGVRGHYLADNIKEEYGRFEAAFRIAQPLVRQGLESE